MCICISLACSIPRFQNVILTSRISCSQAGLSIDGSTHYITFLCCFLDTTVFIYKTSSGEEKDKRSAPNTEFLRHSVLKTLRAPSNEKCSKQLLLVRSHPHLCSNCFFPKVTSSALSTVSFPFRIFNSAELNIAVGTKTMFRIIGTKEETRMCDITNLLDQNLFNPDHPKI